MISDKAVCPICDKNMIIKYAMLIPGGRVHQRCLKKWHDKYGYNKNN